MLKPQSMVAGLISSHSAMSLILYVENMSLPSMKTTAFFLFWNLVFFSHFLNSEAWATLDKVPEVWV